MSALAGLIVGIIVGVIVVMLVNHWRWAKATDIADAAAADIAAKQAYEKRQGRGPTTQQMMADDLRPQPLTPYKPLTEALFSLAKATNNHAVAARYARALGISYDPEETERENAARVELHKKREQRARDRYES